MRKIIHQKVKTTDKDAEMFVYNVFKDYDISEMLYSKAVYLAELFETFTFVAIEDHEGTKEVIYVYNDELYETDIDF